MADNQLLLKKNADDDFFADDDPLAELARIVGFEPPAENRVRPLAERREPEFNLEDELLKEFEQYEAPESVSVPPEPQAEATVAEAEEPVIAAEAELEAEIETAPVSVVVEAVAPIADVNLEAVSTYVIQAQPVDTVAEAPVIVDAVRPAAHPVFELEDEILREFAAFDARRSGQIQPVAPVEAPRVVPATSPATSMDLIDQLMAEFAPPADIAPQMQAEVFEPAFGEPIDDTDAAAAAEPQVESAVGDEPEDALYAEHWHELNEAAFASSEAAPAPSDFEEFVEEPAHFQAAPGWDDLSVATVQDQDVVSQSEQDMGFASAEPIEAPNEAQIEAQVAAPILHVPEPVVATPIAEVEPEHRTFGRRDYELDALLGEVERYPVAEPALQWSRGTPFVVEPKSGILNTPVAHGNEHIDFAPAIASLGPVEAAPDAYIAPVAVEPEIVPVMAEREPVSSIAAIPVHEAFDEGAFELDLSEIELDLLEVESWTDEVARQDAVPASAASLSAMADLSVEELAIPAVDRPRELVFAAPPVIEDYSSLPFDPTQITSEEDPVEAIADLDVPEILQEHHASTIPAAQPDYDIDIDAEMAHLFNRTATQPGRSPAAQAVAAASAAKPDAGLPQSPMADLDDFERALEEDFRKSMTENRAVSNPDRVALSPAGFPVDGSERAPNRRLLMLAASVAAIAVLGGAGLYAFMSGKTSILQTSTEPKIILADKDPVKMVPDDKGGQKVPNQDKAVYDRVSGEQPDQSKQERLVTSNEEPVDVVQKTLMPENLPMDDEGASNVTPTDDTADPRLLPVDAAKDNVSTSEKVTSGVAPRKVRTMVVRADGTLVPREEPVAEVPVAKVEDAALPKETPVELAKTDAEVPERLAESASDSIASEIKEATPVEPVADVKPVEPVAEEQVVEPVAQPVETPVVAEETPVAAADQPEKAVEPLVKSVIKPAIAEDSSPAVEDPIDAQRALDDAANAEVDAPVRTVKTTKIVNANTPIPENRPVEQPVNVVGTVTDQGNVRETTENTQQVASADPVVQPEQTTAVPAGSYVIQIASLPSEAEAQSSYAKLSSKFSSIIGGRGVDIKRAAIKNKGTYYRVRIPAGSKQEAAALCDRYKKAGGSCLVSK